MNIKYDRNKAEEVLTKNKVLVNLIKEFNKSFQDGTSDKFLDENPEFLQMMIHSANLIDAVVEL